MSKIPTAEEVLNRDYISTKENAVKCMIEFAKLHVEAALKEAIDNIEVSIGGDGSPLFSITSILNSYPLENIR